MPMEPDFKKGKGKGKRSGKHVSEVQGNDLEEPHVEENCGDVQADMDDKTWWLFTLFHWVQEVHREPVTQRWLDSA